MFIVITSFVVSTVIVKRRLGDEERKFLAHIDARVALLGEISIAIVVRKAGISDHIFISITYFG